MLQSLPLDASSAPLAPSSLPSAMDDLEACRRLLKGGSRSFYAASFLLPRQTREPATALYAFCRVADDAVDEGGGSLAVIDSLTARVARVYAGNPLPHAVDRAFARVVHGHALPKAVVDALIEGFTWDATDRRYQTFEDVLAYAARVAGCVGIMMTTVMGRRSHDVLARAADLGVAMQLTNIARDVGEDARNGRLYLPLDWLQEAGIDPDAFLARPIFSAALGSIVKRLLDEAELLYARADAGIALLPPGCRCGIRAARLVYAAIGHEVARQGYDSVSRRAVVPFASKLPLLARSLVGTADYKRLVTLPALPTNQFLVNAVVGSTVPRAESGSDTSIIKPDRLPPWWDLAGRFLVALSIFEKLERFSRAVQAHKEIVAVPVSVGRTGA